MPSRTVGTVVFGLIITDAYVPSHDNLNNWLDPICFDGKARTADKCCGHRPHAGPCLWGALLSQGYCCAPDTDCFAWGTFIEGSDIKEPVHARTGLECRHLCQAEPECQGWTFVLSSFPNEEPRFSCWLKSRLWTEKEFKAQTTGLVSGSRHCPSNHERTLFQLKVPRTLDLTQSPGIGIVDPSSDPADFASKAAESVLQYGWAVVRGGLDANHADALNLACRTAMQELLAKDPTFIGNRGPRRYSLGSASKTHHLAHMPEWAKLIDVPAITSILRLIFGEHTRDREGTDEYVSIGGGGDVVLGLTDSVQWLHVDLPRWEMYDQVHPPPGIGVNYAVHDISCNGGAMRLVPGTHIIPYMMDKMTPSEETAMLEEFGLTRVMVCPLKKGDVIIRDLRLWHAGSANLQNEDRMLPNTEYLAPWYANITQGTDDHLAPRQVIPRKVWDALSNHAKYISRQAVAEGPLDTNFHSTITFPQQFD